VLKRFAKETGGEAFFPESSKDITSICEEIARDIRNQYTLTYIPTIASQDGRYRAIEVKAHTNSRGACQFALVPGTPCLLIISKVAAMVIDHDPSN